MSWLYRTSRKIFYQEIFPYPWVNLQGVDLLTFTRCSIQLSLYVGYGWIYVKCQLQPLWMQYFLNDKDESSHFSPWYMFCDWTIQGWISFSAQPECPFSFFGWSKNVNLLLWWTPRCKPSPDYQCFQAFQVFKFLHRLSMFSSWTVDNLSGFLSYRHDQPEPVKLENLNLGYFALWLKKYYFSCEKGSGWSVVALKYKIRQCQISGYHFRRPWIMCNPMIIEF